MRRVLDWCERRGIVVEVAGGKDCYLLGERTIRLRKGRPSTMLHSLLHECGHVLLDSVRAKRWPKGYHAVNTPAFRRGKPHNLDVLAEEIEAWRRGERLARRLGIRLNPREWQKCRAAALASYARLC